MSTSATRDRVTPSGLNRVPLRSTRQGVAEGFGDEEKVVDVDEDDVVAGGARDITMAESETAIRTVTC